MKENKTITDSATNWNTLFKKVALYIKRKKPDLNSGLKTSKELQLFD